MFFYPQPGVFEFKKFEDADVGEHEVKLMHKGEIAIEIPIKVLARPRPSIPENQSDELHE